MQYSDPQLKAISSGLDQGTPLDKIVLPPSPPRKIINTQESRDQQATVKWWKSVCSSYGLPEIALLAFPLQGRRTPRNGARMKREGARKGTLDMMLTVSRKGFHGLWIENKIEGEDLKPEQIQQRDHLITQGYLFRLCRSHQQQKEAITEYLT